MTLTATGTNGSTVAWLAGSGCDTVSGTTGSLNCTLNSMVAAKTAAVTFTAPACTFSISPTSATVSRSGQWQRDHDGIGERLRMVRAEYPVLGDPVRDQLHRQRNPKI